MSHACILKGALDVSHRDVAHEDQLQGGEEEHVAREEILGFCSENILSVLCRTLKVDCFVEGSHEGKNNEKLSFLCFVQRDCLYISG